ncbi:MAG: N-6 DNA methylase [Actinomycetota bacterium]
MWQDNKDVIQADLPGLGPTLGIGMSGARAKSENTKLRGGYYTRPSIADFLAGWAVRRRDAQVLEPSCGDGAIVMPAAKRLGPRGQVTALELYPEEAKKAEIAGGERTEVVTGDAFDWYLRTRPEASFDAVVGNPPFIRYQSWPEGHREKAFRILREEGLHPTRLTNAWAPFVVLATLALRPGGRLGLVVPAELMQVTYAAEIREYLARKYSQLTMLTFRHLVFDGIQQETVLLLGERQDCSSAEVALVEVDSDDDLLALSVQDAKRVRLDLDHAREKWTQYYLSPRELDLIRTVEEADGFTTLGEIAEVDVGIVTGRNDFFVLSPVQARELGLRKWCRPLVARSVHIPGIDLKPEDWKQLLDEDARCLLLQLGDRERDELPPRALAYVEWGEENGVHEGYKCRIRLPRWWNVPSDWIPDAFLLRQINDGPRIIRNGAGATCTDTIHRLRLTDGVSPASIAAASMNSMTFAFSEIRGRSYGGGVLELEPTEAESLPFPSLERELPVEEINQLAREKSVEDVLAQVDRLTLQQVGLTKRETEALRGIWRKLYRRRLSRKAKPRGRVSRLPSGRTLGVFGGRGRLGGSGRRESSAPKLPFS